MYLRGKHSVNQDVAMLFRENRVFRPTVRKVRIQAQERDRLFHPDQ